MSNPNSIYYNGFKEVKIPVKPHPIYKMRKLFAYHNQNFANYFLIAATLYLIVSLIGSVR